MPNFHAYHRTLTAELEAVQRRIHHLIGNKHQLTDGEWKEAALRHLLRRHLPESMLVGRGFIVSEHAASGQIDILIVDRRSPTLFKDGDLMLVTPDAVLAIIEVKTEMTGPAMIEESVRSLAAKALLCDQQNRSSPVWTGLFSYRSKRDRGEQILRALGKTFIDTKQAIDCVSVGGSSLARYWPPQPDEADKWIWYQLTDMAPSYFLANLVQAITRHGRGDRRLAGAFAWFPIAGGKEAHAVCELTCRDDKLTLSRTR